MGLPRDLVRRMPPRERSSAREVLRVPARSHRIDRARVAPALGRGANSWLDQRGELAQYLRRHELYVRHPGSEDRTHTEEGMPDTGFEAVSVQWFDSLARYDTMRCAPGADELHDLDQSFPPASVPSVLTGPPDVIVGPPGGDPSSGSSLLCILRRAPGMELSTFHDLTLRLHHHGGLFQSLPELKIRCSVSSGYTGSWPMPSTTA